MGEDWRSDRDDCKGIPAFEGRDFPVGGYVCNGICCSLGNTPLPDEQGFLFPKAGNRHIPLPLNGHSFAKEAQLPLSDVILFFHAIL